MNGEHVGMQLDRAYVQALALSSEQQQMLFDTLSAELLDSCVSEMERDEIRRRIAERSLLAAIATGGDVANVKELFERLESLGFDSQFQRDSHYLAFASYLLEKQHLDEASRVLVEGAAGLMQSLSEVPEQYSTWTRRQYHILIERCSSQE